MTDMEIHDDPLALFASWYEEAIKLDTNEPTHAVLATATVEGIQIFLIFC